VEPPRIRSVPQYLTGGVCITYLDAPVYSMGRPCTLRCCLSYREGGTLCVRRLHTVSVLWVCLWAKALPEAVDCQYHSTPWHHPHRHTYHCVYLRGGIHCTVYTICGGVVCQQYSEGLDLVGGISPTIGTSVLIAGYGPTVLRVYP
jgi:hypothetical protein